MGKTGQETGKLYLEEVENALYERLLIEIRAGNYGGMERIASMLKTLSIV